MVQGLFPDGVLSYIRRSWRDILYALGVPLASYRVNQEPSWVCPLCSHGEHGDGLTFIPSSKDGNTLKCFGCDFTGDIIDLVGKMENKDFKESVFFLMALLGINSKSPEIPLEAPVLSFNNKSYPDTTEQEKTDIGYSGAKESDFTEYFIESMKALNTPKALNYLKKRGISYETAHKTGIGFDESWTSPTALERGATVYPSERIIIPEGISGYTARAISETAKAPKIKQGKAGLFNAKNALFAQEVEIVFVVEGAFDALAVLEVSKDFQAVSLQGINNIEIFISTIKAIQNPPKFILALDNDPKGMEATEKLKSELDSLGITYSVGDISGSYKDPSERLVEDREGFTRAVNKAAGKEMWEDSIEEYLKGDFSKERENFSKAIKTGFEKWDRSSGGIFPGLYILAAISSLGKTTFALQICDQIAANGSDVLFFSLEQSKLELATKSISRTINGNDPESGVTALGIRLKTVSDALIKKGIEQYISKVGNRISVIEGNFHMSAKTIENQIKRYITITGNRPMIIVDYLQILYPVSERADTRANIDQSITYLKRISRDLEIPIFCISSLNRSSYLKPISFDGLKESGAIEYTADSILGLQYSCMDSLEFPSVNNAESEKKVNNLIQKEKTKRPREISLVCLKNRFGNPSYTIKFQYFPDIDTYIEI